MSLWRCRAKALMSFMGDATSINACLDRTQAKCSRFLEPILSTVGSEKLRKYLRLAQKPLEERYLGVSLNGSEYHSLYTREFSEMLRGKVQYAPLRYHYSKTAGRDPLTRMLYSDFNTWLVDDLLIKADKMTMANSVELRVPGLDYRVVEQAATIPSSMKIRSGEPKWILKQAMRNRLPDSILTRKKQGFLRLSQQSFVRIYPAI
jgi:asparagine synthase (glutamine-hydrolysing)